MGNILITERQFNLLSKKLVKEQSFLQGMKRNVSGWDEWIKNFDIKDYVSWTGFGQSVFGVPLHILLALNFMSFRKSKLKSNEVSSKYINLISDVLCEKSKRMKTCNPGKWTGNAAPKYPNKNLLHYKDYTTHNPKSPTFGESSFTFDSQSEDLKSTMLSFGMSTIEDGGNNWILNDFYDFKNIMEDKTYLKTDSFAQMKKNLATSWGKLSKEGGWTPGNLEEMLTQYHNLGYEGYDVELTIPKGNCNC